MCCPDVHTKFKLNLLNRGEINFSKKLGFLESKTDVQGIMADIRGKIGYAGRVSFSSSFLNSDATADTYCLSMQVGQIPWLDKLLTKNPLFLKLVPTHPIVTFTLDRMKERAEEKAYGAPQKRDFLARCFEAQEKFPEVVSDTMILMYNSDNVGAGSDTTGISLRAVGYIFRVACP